MIWAKLAPLPQPARPDEWASWLEAVGAPLDDGSHPQDGLVDLRQGHDAIADEAEFDVHLQDFEMQVLVRGKISGVDGDQFITRPSDTVDIALPRTPR